MSIKSTNVFRTLVFIVSLAFAVSGTSLAVELPGSVVSTEWLHLHKNDVIILDFRADTDGFVSEPVFEVVDGKKSLVEGGGHIEGARLVDFNTWRVSRQILGKKIDKLVPDAAAVQEMMQALGVNESDALVLTTPGETYDEVDMAARAYWTLKSYGHRAMAVLDGGNAAWGRDGYPLVNSVYTVPVRGDWRADPFDQRWFIDTDGLSNLLESGGSSKIIDARPAPQYLGIVFKSPAVTAPGHIRTAKNFPPDLQVRPRGLAQVFLTDKQYRDIFQATGLATDSSEFVTYCNTGHLAAGAWFVMSEIMGLRDVRLYDGSMHEWTMLGRPVVAEVK